MQNSSYPSVTMCAYFRNPYLTLWRPAAFGDFRKKNA